MSIRHIILVFTLILTVSAAQKVALLVETAGGPNLYTDKDVVTIKKLLGDAYKYKIISHKQATSANIRKALQEMSTLKADDTFVFYYSGHGARFQTGDSGEADGKDDFLVTADVSCKNNAVTGVLSDNELNYLYAQIPARKIILIDACHSQTMYKGLSDGENTKYFKGCVGASITQGSTANTSFLTKQATNFLHIGASKENESAEGSKDGGIFTLALAKAIKENGNIPFSVLIQKVQENIRPVAASRKGCKGQFVPTLASVGVDADKLYTKDIFVIPKTKKPSNALKTYLDANIKNSFLKIQEDKHAFKRDDFITLKATIANKKSYIYLLEMFDIDSYVLLDKRTDYECLLLPNKKEKLCQYQDFVGSTPFGKSEVYSLVTSEPLYFNKPTKSIMVTVKPLVEQLKKMSFSVSKVTFTVNPKE